MEAQFTDKQLINLLHLQFLIIRMYFNSTELYNIISENIDYN